MLFIKYIWTLDMLLGLLLLFFLHIHNSTAPCMMNAKWLIVHTVGQATQLYLSELGKLFFSGKCACWPIALPFGPPWLEWFETETTNKKRIQTHVRLFASSINLEAMGQALGWGGGSCAKLKWRGGWKPYSEGFSRWTDSTYCYTMQQ